MYLKVIYRDGLNRASQESVFECKRYNVVNFPDGTHEISFNEDSGHNTLLFDPRQMTYSVYVENQDGRTINAWEWQTESAPIGAKV